MAFELGKYPRAPSENSRSAVDLENTKISLEFSTRKITNKYGTAFNFTK